MRSPGQIEEDIRKMIHALDGPYYVARERLAYLVSDEEYRMLCAVLRANGWFKPGYVETPEGQEPKDLKLLGIPILKKENI